MWGRSIPLPCRAVDLPPLAIGARARGAVAFLDACLLVGGPRHAEARAMCLTEVLILRPVGGEGLPRT